MRIIHSAVPFGSIGQLAGNGSAKIFSIRSQRSRSLVRSFIKSYPGAAHDTARDPFAPGGVPTPGISVGPHVSGPDLTT